MFMFYDNVYFIITFFKRFFVNKLWMKHVSEYMRYDLTDNVSGVTARDKGHFLRS